MGEGESPHYIGSVTRGYKHACCNGGWLGGTAKHDGSSPFKKSYSSRRGGQRCVLKAAGGRACAAFARCPCGVVGAVVDRVGAQAVLGRGVAGQVRLLSVLCLPLFCLHN